MQPWIDPASNASLLERRTATVLLPEVNVLLAGFRGDHVHHKPAPAFLRRPESAP